MQNLILLIDQVLPASIGSPKLSYNEQQNLLVTTGYTSYAGNTYFKGFRISDRIFIVLEIGIGYAHTFLNGLKIYSNQGSEKKLIAEKRYYCVLYNEVRVKTDAKEMVKEELKKELTKTTTKVDEEWLVSFVDQVVDDTYKSQIETLKTLQVNKLLSK